MVRSIGPSQFGRLQRYDQVDWVCLQYGDVTEALAEAAGDGVELCHDPQAIADLDEFAALVKGLDLVITVCNTTVHFAGALNVPVWVLAPRIPEWRYGLHFAQMPWYPSSRMFRQTTAGDWNDVFERVALALDQFVTDGAKRA